MTEFDKLLKELGVKIKYHTVQTVFGEMEQYNGLAKAIYDIGVEVLFEGNITDTDEWSKETKARALKLFPYLNH